MNIEYTGLFFLDIEDESVWRVVSAEWSRSGSGSLVFTMEHFQGAEERREVEDAWLLPGGHYRKLSEMEVIAWMAHHGR